MVLKALEQEGAFLQPLLDKLSQEAELSPEDRRLAWEITLGVSRYWSRLLYSVKYYIKPKEGEEIPKEILRILVIAAYQFTFLDKIPAHAIINEAVELAKIVNIRLKNLVNGTLRSFQKDGEQYKDGNRPEELAVRLSHPTWWVEYQLESKPLSDVLALARFNNGHAPLTVRFNPKFKTKETLDLLAQENATVTKAKYVPNAYHLEHPQPFQSETFKDQRWIVQDEGSQLIVHLLGVKPGSKVWDVCAAPGGKTTLLWDLMQHQGQILATETNDRKAKELSEKLKDETEISVVVHDATKALAQKQQFDYILIDAPCSALGVIRRHPEIKWRRQPIDIKSSAAIQEKILNQASLYLKKGGYLVYSVCSDHPLEGIKQIQKFLLVNPDFKIVQPDLQSPIDWTKLLDSNLSLNIDPYHHQTDGFFAIRLRKG
jgi:16S rRNA (cytosine967-C5)-methyltransferase